MKITEIREIIDSNDKGVIVELLSNKIINSVNYITCKRGYVYGNHYHKYTSHYNYVVAGEILLVTQINNDKQIKTFLKKGEMYTIAPMVKHAIFAMEDAEILVLVKGPNGNDEFESDTYPTWEPLIR